MIKQLYHLTDLKLNLLILKIKTHLNVAENPVQNLIKFKKSLNEPEQTLFDVIAEHIIKAESVSPMGGEVMMDYLSGIDNESCNRQLTADSLSELLSTFVSDNHIKSMVLDAVQLAGLTGKLMLTTSSNDNLFVELLNGYTFYGLTPAFDFKKFELNDSMIIPIDGYIESVSEIHHLLEHLSSSRQTAVLFVRGLSEDVKNTLKVNYDRKTVVCVPVVVQYDIEGVNTLNDIATISCCDVVSATKGQLISSIDVSRLQPIDVVTFYNDCLVLLNKKSSRHVERHVSMLKNKLIEVELDASKEILKKRIQRLGTRQVNIKVPNDAKKAANTFQLDRCIRAINLSTAHGLTVYNGKVYPKSTILTAKMYSQELLKKLNDIGCIVINK